MKLIINALILMSAMTSISFAETNNCESLNNSTWHTDEFNATVNGGFIHCTYVGTATFKTKGNNINAVFNFKKIQGKSCENEKQFELTGTCGIEKMYTIRLHDSASQWRGFWSQEERIGIQTTSFPMMDGAIHGLLEAYFVK